VVKYTVEEGKTIKTCFEVFDVLKRTERVETSCCTDTVGVDAQVSSDVRQVDKAATQVGQARVVVPKDVRTFVDGTV
jgi:hypothetical protein